MLAAKYCVISGNFYEPMSRIGRKIIELPKGVNVKQDGGVLRVKGPKGELEVPVAPGIASHLKENELSFTRASEDKKTRALHGLTRALATALCSVSRRVTRRNWTSSASGTVPNCAAKHLCLRSGFPTRSYLPHLPISRSASRCRHQSSYRVRTNNWWGKSRQISALSARRSHTTARVSNTTTKSSAARLARQPQNKRLEFLRNERIMDLKITLQKKTARRSRRRAKVRRIVAGTGARPR